VTSPIIDRLTLRILALVGCLTAFVPAFARDDLKIAPARLTLHVATDPAAERCRRIETTDPASSMQVYLHRTFHDDFDEHPLFKGKWVPHYAGGAAWWPQARYWGGDGSDFKRKTAYNGEQQIYVDPRYGGRTTTPLAWISTDRNCPDMVRLRGLFDQSKRQTVPPGDGNGFVH
jgi:hypothetical protein